MMMNNKTVVVSLLLLIIAVTAGPLSAWSASSVIVTDNPGTIHVIVVDPTDSNIVYAAAETAGVLKTTDNGATWTAMTTGLTPIVVGGQSTFSVTDLAIDPVSPTTLYLAAASGAYKSVDGGETWAALALSTDLVDPTAVAVYEAAPNNVMVGTATSGLFSSDDYGATWNFRGGQEDGACNGLLVTEYESQSDSSGRAGSSETDPDEPVKPAVYWKITPQGVFEHSDAFFSREWIPVGLSHQHIYSILGSKVKKELFGQNNAVVYVGVHESGIFTSTDSGETWTQLDTPGGVSLAEMNINGMAEGPPDPDSIGPSPLYATSWDGVLLKGVEQDGVWTFDRLVDRDALGLTEFHPKAVAVVPMDGLADDRPPAAPAIWTGTFGYGVTDNPPPGTIYYSPDDGASWANALAEGYWVNQ